MNGDMVEVRFAPASQDRQGLSSDVAEVVGMMMALDVSDRSRPYFDRAPATLQKINEFAKLRTEINRLRGKESVDGSTDEPVYESMPGSVTAFLTDTLRRDFLGEKALRVWDEHNSPHITEAEMARFKLEAEKAKKPLMPAVRESRAQLVEPRVRDSRVTVRRVFGMIRSIAATSVIR